MASGRRRGRGRFPEVPARAIMMDEAKSAMDNAFLQVRRKYELTPAEEISILSGAISTITHHVIKMEREQVEEAVKQVGDGIRVGVGEPFTGVPQQAKCFALMNNEQIKLARELDMKPGACCPKAGECNGQVGTDNVVLFSCPSNCPCHN